MISFEAVTISMQGRELVRDVAFLIRPGEKVVLCGRSGSGKSTLLKAVVGGAPIAAGVIRVNGLAVLPENILQIRQELAYISQEPGMSRETAADDLLLPFSFKAHSGKEPTAAQIEVVLARLLLDPGILRQKSATLSGGEKQRLVIARAILLNKRIFLADEITSALDAESKQAVLAFLLETDHTVLSISHDPDWIGRCSRVFTIDNNTLREEK
ncbi:MAG: ATP-binding cassette domain-containing protein [Pseudomonadota bacterium]